jgi:hypothetical protein
MITGDIAVTSFQGLRKKRTPMPSLQLALDNFVEMRDLVAADISYLRKKIEARLHAVSDKWLLPRW